MARTSSTQKRSAPRIYVSLVGMIAAFVLLVMGIPAAYASPAVVTLETIAVASTVESGSRISFRVNYSCSSLAAVCEAPTVHAPAPVGTAPGGQEIQVEPGSGQVVRSAHVESVTGTDAMVIQFANLEAGSSGQITVSWAVKNIVTPPGTTFQQTVSLTPELSNPKVSAPVTVTAVSQFEANLIMLSPSSPQQVVTGREITYAVYDCNPGLTSLNGLGYEDLTMTMTLPFGIEIVEAADATVTIGDAASGTTLTWSVSDPSVNDCETPNRTYPVRVIYPKSFNLEVPSGGSAPRDNPVEVTLTAHATGVGGGALTDSDSLNHVFAGHALSSGTSNDYLFWAYGSYWSMPHFYGITSTNGVTPYGFYTSQWWVSEPPGEVATEGTYQVQSAVSRVPCIVNGTIQTREPSSFDPIGSGEIGTLAPQPNPCMTPAHEVTRLDFANIVAPWVWGVQVQTTDGTTSRVHEWTPDERPTEAFYLEMYTNGENADSAVRADPYGMDSAAPAAGTGGFVSEQITDIDPEPLFDRAPLTDWTMTNPVVETMNIPENERVTDVRVVYRDVPYYTRAYVVIWGVSSPELISLANGEAASMTTQVRNYSNRSVYTEIGNPRPGQTFSANVSNIVFNLQAEYSDPQIAGKGLFAVDDPNQSNLGAANGLAPGDSVTWQFGITNGPNGATGGCQTGVPNSCNGLQPEAVVVLPPGLEYEEGSVTWSNLESMDGVEPELVIGSVSAGYPEERVTLSWKWPGGQRIPNPADDPMIAEGIVPTVVFKTRVSLYAQEGHNDGINAISVSLFDAGRVVEAEDGRDASQVDGHDLNQNGNTRERIAQATADWTVASSSGVQMRPLAQGDLDTNWGQRGQIGLTWDSEGGTGMYRFEARNINTSAVRNIVVYSTVPHIGDTAISEALSDESRGTQWNPIFAGLDEAAELRSGTQVFYSTSANSCRPELFPNGQGSCDDDWSLAAPNDLSTVRALKWVETEDYQPTTETNPPLQFGYRVTAPAVGSQEELVAHMGTVANANVAWRGARVTGSNPDDFVTLEPAEARAVPLVLTAGKIAGVIWNDTNLDGVRDAGEPGVGGVHATLRAANGTAITDPSGEVVTAVTDASGEYALFAPIGTYRVGFTDIPAGARWTEPVRSLADASGSHVDPSTGQTADIMLTGEVPHQIHVNGGLAGLPLLPSDPATGAPGAGGTHLAQTGGSMAMHLGVYAALGVLVGCAVLRARSRSRVRGRGTALTW